MTTPPTDLGNLQRRFGLEGVVSFEAGQGGLPRMVVRTAAAQAHIYLHGAHVQHYQPAGHQPLLFASASSRYQPGQPIRGGVPIVFPWFGAKADNPDAPPHGLARILPWQVESITRDAAEQVNVTLALTSDLHTRRLWPHEFALRYHVGIGGTLSTALEVRNTGSTPFTFEEALHTYLAVSDVRRVRVQGLGNTEYLDKVDAGRRKRQDAQPIAITAETDRVYLNAPGGCVIHDPGLSRRILLTKFNSASTVLWNPWIAKAQRMEDFGDEEWPGMLCLETANVMQSAVVLQPGRAHRMTAVIQAVFSAKS